MMTAPFILLFLLLRLADFTSFSYCHENTRGTYEIQCIQLDAEATGEATFKRRQAETVNVPIQLSQPAREKFMALLAATNYLDHPETFESGKKIADLGAKRLTIEMPGGNREATFNYSLRKDVTDLSAFFEGLINQETLGFDIRNAMQFEKLSIPKRLEQVENELKANRISDPDRLIPMLERIEADQQIVNYARMQAARIKKRIQTAAK
ncbi:MAG: hypothetical protein DMG16_18275 [Acidobacteria bacterium]|nr:MAG: hypothetical protein DMG16_18275 [Acidobacteriota bacterium]